MPRDHVQLGTALAEVVLTTLIVLPTASEAGGKVPVPMPAPTPHQQALDRAHGEALASFRRARFSEAYGRFIKLADAGHPASARYAIWMCENGSTLFGVPWDCAPQEVEEWASAARLPAAPPAGAGPTRRR